MGPKKNALRKDNERDSLSIDDNVNTDDWKCLVVLAVEKSCSDTFVLKDFTEEASSGRRRDIGVISYEYLVLKILNDFSNGELSYNHAFLIRFSHVFQEAAKHVQNKTDIPVNLLVKIVKAFLFFFRDESLKKMEKKKMGPNDPVRAMAERPFDVGDFSQAKSGLVKKESLATGKAEIRGSDQVGRVKIRPPSLTKEETRLLKRGEGAKETQCIDDAPTDGLFQMYILLTGFYSPEFPVELVKAHVPLHGLLCVDTISSEVGRITSFNPGKIQKKAYRSKSLEIKTFWEKFLSILWNPRFTSYFKEVIFQVYSPPKLHCDAKKKKEFFYKEISYLMYDLSDYKTQHLVYLKNLKLWNVEARKENTPKRHGYLVSDTSAGACSSAAIVLLRTLNAVCEEDDSEESANRAAESPSSVSSGDRDRDRDRESDPANSVTFSQSLATNKGSSLGSPPWSLLVFEAGDENLLNAYSKVKNLDLAYGLNGKGESNSVAQSQESRSGSRRSEASGCRKPKRTGASNIDEAVYSDVGLFGTFWKVAKAYGNEDKSTLNATFDYCLYAFLMSKLPCSNRPLKIPPLFPNNFENDILLWNRDRKDVSKGEGGPRTPRFSATEGIFIGAKRCISYNLKKADRNLFCPQKFKETVAVKMKAASAPEFRVPSISTEERSFVSELIVPGEIIDDVEWNVFENLPTFLAEKAFSYSNGFDFVEELDKSKLLAWEERHLEEFTCIDYAYSALFGTLFAILHRRNDPGSFDREIFNSKLKTKIGLRDFYEYVLEDEFPCFARRKKSREKKLPLKKFESGRDAASKVSDSDFWLPTSLKRQHNWKSVHEGAEAAAAKANEFPSWVAKEENRIATAAISRNFDSCSNDSSNGPEESRPPANFEGYNLEGLAVQFSGVKTTYFAGDSSVNVELVERLYGDQVLGVHVRLGGHVFHSYSYVCPRPHISHPYTCHLTYQNGMVAAFGRRTDGEEIKVEETPEETGNNAFSADAISSEPATTAAASASISRNFAYDLKLSMPNGLFVEVLHEAVRKPYIKQRFLEKPSTAGARAALDEKCRLFLADGSLVKMMRDGTTRMLKANASIVTAASDASRDSTSETSGNDVATFLAGKYEMITSEGKVLSVDKGLSTIKKTFRVFRNFDVESNRIFLRRADGTDCVIESDGTLCVEFQDGTKMSHTPIVTEGFPPSERPWGEAPINSGNRSDDREIQEPDSESDFLFVSAKIVTEHPNYATTVYDGFTGTWKIILPFESTITVKSGGIYSVEIDRQTELTIHGDSIVMNRFSRESGSLMCSFQVDLSVFGESGRRDDVSAAPPVYCKMNNFISGETYVVEADSKCYVLPAKEAEGENKKCRPGESGSSKRETPAGTLTRNKKYFVVRKDFTGFEVIHREDVDKALTEMENRSLVHVKEFGERRCFVILSPQAKEKPWHQRWQVNTVLPDPKFSESAGNRKRASSTYGVPPSWMHPFPVRKPRFEIPESVRCRVFAETKKTDFSPGKGGLDCRFFEFPEASGMEFPGEAFLECTEIQEYAKLFSANDQALLTGMYLRTAREKATEMKNLSSRDAREFAGRLALLKRDIDSQEFHRRAIRHGSVPNYFSRSRGIGWLVLFELLQSIKFDDVKAAHSASREALSKPPAESASSFSNEEIEYNLEWSPTRSYSELSYVAGASSKTAPAVLTRGTARVRQFVLTRNATSAPELTPTNLEGSHDHQRDQPRICLLAGKDLNTDDDQQLLEEVAFEDLLRLALI